MAFLVLAAFLYWRSRNVRLFLSGEAIVFAEGGECLSWAQIADCSGKIGHGLKVILALEPNPRLNPAMLSPRAKLDASSGLVTIRLCGVKGLCTRDFAVQAG